MKRLVVDDAVPSSSTAPRHGSKLDVNASPMVGAYPAPPSALSLSGTKSRDGTQVVMPSSFRPADTPRRVARLETQTRVRVLPSY